ncbi:hypothetical protein Leryth_014109 [Lithospermum erythrorhizon]|nr:hypothetical protein Leryth_014109 [Lithospermum erythrorhizon]
MDLIILSSSACPLISAVNYHHLLPSTLPHRWIPCDKISLKLTRPSTRPALPVAVTNSVPQRDGSYTVGDFMTRKEELHVVKPCTSVDEGTPASFFGQHLSPAYFLTFICSPGSSCGEKNHWLSCC